MDVRAAVRKEKPKLQVTYIQAGQQDDEALTFPILNSCCNHEMTKRRRLTKGSATTVRLRAAPPSTARDLVHASLHLQCSKERYVE